MDAANPGNYSHCTTSCVVSSAQLSRHSELFQSTLLAEERKRSNARKLDGAVGRMRRLQEQAWADNDEDDRRERQVLALGQQPQPAADGKDGKDARQSNASIKYQSQRSQYLRIILDAEKEIARLEGLYEGMLDVDGAVGFVVIRRDQSTQSDSQSMQSGQIATSAPNRALPAPADTLTDGVI